MFRYAGIEKTGWMEHVLSVVRGACKVAEMLSTAKSSVVLHCRYRFKFLSFGVCNA
jgi:hypothetical protein